jgi:hypothetical protein
MIAKPVSDPLIMISLIHVMLHASDSCTGGCAYLT